MTANVGISFHACLDGGSADVPTHIVRVPLKDQSGKAVETWNGGQLEKPDKSAFANNDIYNKFRSGMESIVAGVRAKATISLPPATPNMVVPAGNYVIEDQFKRKRILDSGKPFVCHTLKIILPASAISWPGGFISASFRCKPGCYTITRLFIAGGSEHVCS